MCLPERDPEVMHKKVHQVFVDGEHDNLALTLRVAPFVRITDAPLYSRCHMINVVAGDVTWSHNEVARLRYCVIHPTAGFINSLRN